MGGFYTDYSYIGIMPESKKKQVFATEKEYKDFLKERKEEMAIQELIKFLENQIEKCKKEASVLSEYGCINLWTINNAKKEAYQEVLDRIQGS